MELAALWAIDPGDIDPYIVFVCACRYQHDCPLYASSALHITVVTYTATYKALLRVYFEDARTVFIECPIVGIANNALGMIQYTC
jgi:hypothetical protein